MDATQRWQRNTVRRVSALLAFAAALLTLRLSGDLVRRYRRRRAPELAAWAAGLGAYSVAAGALAWGAAAGWSDAAFRVYYLGGALLTAALLGVGSLLLVGRRWIAPVALVYVGIAIGIAVAVPLHGTLTGTDIPEAQDVLDLWPARTLAIVGNSVGTLARRRRGAPHVQVTARRKRADPRGHRGRGNRKRAGRDSGSVRWLRRSPWRPSSSTPGSSPRRRSRSHAHPSTPRTPSAIADSAIAPMTPPWATIHG